MQQLQLCSVFRVIIESHLRYLNFIWGSLSKTNLDTFQRLHNRAYSIIEIVFIKDEWSYNLLTVEIVIRCDRSVMAYKALKAFGISTSIDPHTQIMNQGAGRIFRS